MRQGASGILFAELTIYGRVRILCFVRNMAFIMVVVCSVYIGAWSTCMGTIPKGLGFDTACNMIGGKCYTQLYKS
jgi:hypothetical protein